MKLATFPLLLSALTVTGASAQISRLGHDIDYSVEASGTVANGDYAPFWLTANRQGLSSTACSSGYVRAAAGRDVDADSARRWRIGYGADVAVPLRYTSPVVIQQLYADFRWRDLGISVGSKERRPELKHYGLSTGGLTYSGNARPVPQVRFEVPDFWTVPGTKNWLALKAHVAFGITTDGRWQTDFVTSPSAHHATRVLYHSKAAFWRIGNTEKLPLTFTGGLEMAAQFGGKVFNMYMDSDNTPQNLYNGLSSFWHAFIPSGHDITDGDNPNVEGNQVGSWHFSLDYHGKGWGLRFYGEHQFEDHSQMFLQYGWKDMLYGVEAQLPHNPIVSTIVYEHYNTMDQSGPIYHDADVSLPIQISGGDGYYNHSTYGSFQHWGQIIGNPLVASPIYNTDGSLSIRDNRIKAHHIGLSGDPGSQLSYRLLFTHLRSLGNYGTPRIDPVYANYFLAALTYKPRWCHGLSIEGSFATNGGELLGSSRGGMLTIRKTGSLRK